MTAAGPDAVAMDARRRYVGMADGSLPTEGRWLLVMRGRRRGRRRLQVASCRGAPPRQLERRGLTGLEAADPARLTDATGPQRMLLLAEDSPAGVAIATLVSPSLQGDPIAASLRRSRAFFFPAPRFSIFIGENYLCISKF